VSACNLKNMQQVLAFLGMCQLNLIEMLLMPIVYETRPHEYVCSSFHLSKIGDHQSKSLQHYDLSQNHPNSYHEN
jgi:hypothetical protein